LNPQGLIDSYLERLRRCLKDLPPGDVDDILLEIRGHIQERSTGTGATDSASMERVLAALGTPEAIGALYRGELLVARARAGFSPLLIIRTTYRWAMKTMLGLVVFLMGVIGYGLGLTFIASGVLKPFFPDNVGLWIDPHGMQLAVPTGQATGPELLGWWIIPLAPLLGAVMMIGTTLFLRWMLRFASHPPGRAAVPT
jgi:hypothetical protein